MNKYNYFIVEFSEQVSVPRFPVENSAIKQDFYNPIHKGDYIVWYDKGKTLGGSISGWVRRIRHYPDYSVLDIEPDRQ